MAQQIQIRRAKPGERGIGDYYRIIVRPKQEFVTFRIQDVGRKGHTQRLTGKRSSGRWDTQAWLISKKDAHIQGRRLVADNSNVKKILSNLSTSPTRVEGDIFKAKDRRNIP